MKILVFSRATLSHTSGGLERHLDILTNKLVKRGHSVTVVTTRHPEGIEEKVIDGVKYYYLRKTVPSSYSQNYFLESAKLAKKSDVDIVWSQSSGGLGWIKYHKELRLKAIPFVTYVHGHILELVIGYIQSSLTNPKLEWQSENGEAITAKERSKSGFSLKRILNDYIDAQRIFSHSNAVISVSRRTLRTVKYTHFLTSKKCQLVYNGVDSETFKPDINASDRLRLRLRLPSDEKVVLSIGRLERIKGVQYLVEAFRRLLKTGTKATLIIVGDGSYRNYLERIISEADLERKVILTGTLEPKELPQFYNLCDVFVLPSLLTESFSLVTLEAMACGKPVIATKVGATPEQIRHMQNGILVPPGDAESICRNMLLLLKDRPELALYLGRNARERVVREFDSNVMSKKVESIFINLISENRSQDIVAQGEEASQQPESFFG